jgi:hypothetical protein
LRHRRVACDPVLGREVCRYEPCALSVSAALVAREGLGAQLHAGLLVAEPPGRLPEAVEPVRLIRVGGEHLLVEALRGLPVGAGEGGARFEETLVAGGLRSHDAIFSSGWAGPFRVSSARSGLPAELRRRRARRAT